MSEIHKNKGIFNLVDELEIDHKAVQNEIVTDLYTNAEKIAQENITHSEEEKKEWGTKFDGLLTSRWLGFPTMILMLGVVFWITIVGANYPSAMLAKFLFWIEGYLTQLFVFFHAPAWLEGIMIKGVYRTLAWVISVMLPPMAIFFPIFTFLEDLGLLPRIAFNLDNFFKKAGTNGKQALTMSMGFGCNAAGVIAARIIESPREKMIAILTNNFVPCNGRFPTLIILASLFMGSIFGGVYNSLAAAAVIVALILVGITITLFISWLLSKTLLRGVQSSFSLELPPYRRPKIKDVLLRSFIDRTLFVLSRAVVVAAPAGAVVWLAANLSIGELSLIQSAANWLNPFAILIGLDGAILLAFILGLPANEIVLPILVMSYLSAGAMLEPSSSQSLKNILVDNGWTWVTALSTMLFSLLHFPCATTLLTIKRETNSWKWTIFAALMPLAVAIIVCFLVTQGIYLFF